ncbi:MAG TPA: DNA polymerase III subunit delta, partial [Opitutales bacterium]|nr:DNA polymerase III subunit delta [Opitutales bacterium]
MGSSFTLICGGDDYLVAREGAKVWEKLCREVEDEYSREIVDGGAGTVAEAGASVASFASAAMTMPMFGGKKCVWLRNISFLGDTQLGKSEGAKESVEKLLKVLEKVNPADVGILLTACPVDRRKKEFKRLSELGEVQVVGDGKGESPALRILEEELARFGAKIAPDVAYALVEKIHGNSRMAMEEARKLATYADGNAITMESVGALVPPFGEGDFFEAVDAFYSLDLDETLDAIRRHFFAGNDIRPLISSLQNRARLLLQLRVLYDAGCLRGGVNQSALGAAAEKFGSGFASDAKSSSNVFTQNPYYLMRLMDTAKKLRVKKLIDFQMEFIRAFSEAIERPNEQEAVMR